MKSLLLFAIFFVGLTGAALAQKAPELPADASGKFTVQGTTIIYNTDNAPVGSFAEMESGDVEQFSALLAQNPNAKVLQLNSVGGSVWAGEEMARIVMDYRLNTRVRGECSSSCVTLFLAGTRREMARGSSIGFHQNTWTAEGLRNYYKYWQNDESWHSPFEFGAWLYKDTQTEVHDHLVYMLARGVDPAFAIETKRERSSMWYPPRRQLEDAGVLRD